MAKKKSNTGRPTDYDDKYPELLIEHLKKGYSFESFGGVVGACKKTLYNWCDAVPEFLHAKNKGQSYSLLEWERKGIDGLYNETFKDEDGMTVSRSINTSIWIFNMKNRFGWRDKIEVSEEDETDLITEFTKDETNKTKE